MNAKEELIKALGDNAIRCASIGVRCRGNKIRYEYTLRTGYTSFDYDHFMYLLDFYYSEADDFITQVVGTVWLNDGSWMARDAHEDGELYWSVYSAPSIPNDLL